MRLGLVESLKNTDFVSESNSWGNQNKNLKQPNLPAVVWKLCFALEINQ